MLNPAGNLIADFSKWNIFKIAGYDFTATTLTRGNTFLEGDEAASLAYPPPNGSGVMTTGAAFRNAQGHVDLVRTPAIDLSGRVYFSASSDANWNPNP